MYTYVSASSFALQLTVVKKNSNCQSTILDSCLSNCRASLNNRSLLMVSVSKRELLLILQGELLYGSGSESISRIRKQMPTDFPNMPLEDPQQHSRASSISQPSLKRKNSKAPLFPAIDETGETDVALSSPDTVVGKKDEQHVVDVGSNLPPPLRPTSLPFKPPFEKKKSESKISITGNAGSPKIIKSSKPSVSFAENRSPSSKKIFGSGFSKQFRSSPVIEKPKRSSYKQSSRRIAHIERLGKDIGESGFEADEEDASLETPRSSVSYFSSSTQCDELPKQTSTSKLADMPKTISVSAEVHEQDKLSLTSTESNDGSVTSLSSEDIPMPLPEDTKKKLAEGKCTIKHPKILADDSSYSPSTTRRNLFKLSHSKNVHVDEPDEQTGQLKHDQSEYLREPKPNIHSGNSSPQLLTASQLTCVDSEERKTLQQKMFNKGLKQLDNFLGHSSDQWPPDEDDCSV